MMTAPRRRPKPPTEIDLVAIPDEFDIDESATESFEPYTPGDPDDPEPTTAFNTVTEEVHSRFGQPPPPSPAPGFSVPMPTAPEEPSELIEPSVVVEPSEIFEPSVIMEPSELRPIDAPGGTVVAPRPIAPTSGTAAASRKRARTLVFAAIGAGALILLVGGVLLAGRLFGGSCGDAASLSGVWDNTHREGVKAAILGSGQDGADATWERLGPSLDAYAGSWSAARRGACESEEPPAEREALQAACLDRRRVALKALVDALAKADADAALRAIEASAALPSIAPCDDVASLRAAAAPPDDPKVAAEVTTLREQIAAAQVALDLGRREAARELAASIRERADEIAYPPLEAEVMALQGALEIAAGDHPAAEATLTRAVWLADQVRDDPLLAETMGALIREIAVVDRRPADALALRPHAETVLARLPEGAPAAAPLLAALGAALGLAGDAAANDHLERALKISEASFGEASLRLRDPLIGLGRIAAAKGDRAAANERFDRVIAIFEGALGPEHPTLGVLLGEIARIDADADDLDAALARSQRGLTILEASLADDHPDLGQALADAGAIAQAKGDLDAARSHLGRALTIREKSQPADHLEVGDALARLGAVELAQGDTDAAIPHLERALKIREAHAEERPPVELARSQAALAGALRSASREPERVGELASAALAALREHDPEGSKELIDELASWLGEAPPAAKASSKKKKKKTKKKSKKKSTKKKSTKK
ncbi:MAG: tetratricopeptide repeat protein [Myxococcales bacterium]|nr:tetratricopeptide repeat protein [Myxococcales bacterium]